MIASDIERRWLDALVSLRQYATFRSDGWRRTASTEFVPVSTSPILTGRARGPCVCAQPATMGSTSAAAARREIEVRMAAGSTSRHAPGKNW